jgi:multiple sugar transport system permease protein
MKVIAPEKSLSPTPPAVPLEAGRRREKRIPSSPAYRRNILWVLLVPALLAEFLVYIVPILAGIYTSFTDVNQFTLRSWFTAPFVWFENFWYIVGTRAIGEPIVKSFITSVVYVVIVVVISMFIGTTALIFVRSLPRRQKFFQVLFVIPYTVPVYAAAVTWAFVFQGNGAMNTLFHSDLHLMKSTLWLEGDPAFISLVIASVWHTWPFVFLMMLGASSNIPTELYEALRVDGGGRWQEARNITLPFVSPTARILALLLFMWTFNDFVTPFVFFGEIPPSTANLFPLDIYTTTFVNFAFSVGTAASLLAILVLSVTIVLPYAKITRFGADTNE